MLDPSYFYNKLKSRLTRGHERSMKAKQNILISGIVKFASMATSLIIVPLTLSYVSNAEYGIWLTISSVFGWISLFDIGLGGGLRNRLTEALAENDRELAKTYVSTTYAALTLIMLGATLLFLLVNPFLNWSDVLNTSQELSAELKIISYVVFILFAVQFVLKLINTVLTADQQIGKASVFNFLGSFISLAAIYILIQTTTGSLTNLVLVLSISPIIVSVITSLFYFNKHYRDISPSIKFIKFSYIKNVANLGLQFFIIQIAATIVYSASNFLIAQFFGPEQVTPYNISYRLFNTLSVVFFIIIAPFTAAFTDAYYKKDFDWIRRIVKKLIRVWIYTSLCGIILLLISPFIFKIWISDKVQIPFLLSICIVIYFILLTWNAIFTAFLNGAGKIRLQLIASIGEAIIFIPLAYLFAVKLDFGISGIVIASSIPLFIGSFWLMIQYNKLINLTAQGIWDK